ncbi:MAG: septum site-determining protein MinC [Burkholderiales bacterium]
MTVALAGRAPATFEIKSANLPLVALLLKSTDLSLLEAEFDERFAETPNFFEDDPLVIDLSPLAANAGDVDFGRLAALLKARRMAPIAFKGGTERHAVAARAAGLVAAPDAEMQKNAVQAAEKEAAPPSPKSAARAQTRQPPAATPATAAEANREAARQAPPPTPGALVIHKQVRSGQQIYAKGRDLVVLTTVNAGAEVIADGHVHIYGSLRGKAIAGARGNTEARIFALSLEAELIAIAGTYRTSETPLPPDVFGQPTQIRLVGEKLLMEPLKN